MYEDKATANKGFRTKFLVPAWVFCRWGRACSDTFGLTEAEAKRIHGEKWDGGFVGFTQVEGVFDWRGAKQNARSDARSDVKRDAKRDIKGKRKANAVVQVHPVPIDVVPAEVIPTGEEEEEDWGTLDLDPDLSGAGALETGERGLFGEVTRAKGKQKAKTKTKTKGKTKGRRGKKKAATPTDSDPDR